MKYVSLSCLLYILSFFSFAQSADIKIGVSPVTSSAGIFIAKEKGYFEKAGINQSELVIVRNSGAPMTVLLAKGELDVGGGNINAGLYSAINSGQMIKVVADKGHLEKEQNYISLIIRKDLVSNGKFKTIESMKGYKLGFTSETGVSQQILLEKMLVKNKLKISDIEIVKLSYPEMNMALKNKLIDGAIQLEPYATMAILSGDAVKVAGGADFYLGQQSAGILFSAKLLTEKRNLGCAFLAAYLKGVEDYNDAYSSGKNKKEILTILKKYIAIDSDEVWEKSIPAGLSKSGSLNKASMIEDINWYVTNKYLDKAPAIDQVIDEKFSTECKAQKF